MTSTLAVGDIHGNLVALADLLGQLRAEAAAGDVVVFLGDYIDRRADSRGCVDAILSFRRDSPAETVCLLVMAIRMPDQRVFQTGRGG